MSIEYVNGRYLDYRDAAVHTNDRGYQFGDGIYEVVAFKDSTLIDKPEHFTRLKRSTSEVGIPMPMSLASLEIVINEVIRKNRIKDGYVYMQVTRGTAPRNHQFRSNMMPNLVISAKRHEWVPKIGKGVNVVTGPDTRWKRRDIKNICLLPNILAKNAAKESGVYETWLVNDDGTITEGNSSNAYIVKDGILITRPKSNNILGGVVRDVILRLARDNNIPVNERSFTVEEAYNADEAMSSSSSTIIKPILKIDDKIIGDGTVGQISTCLYDIYYKNMEKQVA